MDQEMDMTNITPSNEEKKGEDGSEVVSCNDSNSENIDNSDNKTGTGFLDANSKVKLISSDGQAFSLDYDCVIQSGTIKTLLNSNPRWIENKTGILEFPCIDSKILAKVVEYMIFKKLHADKLVEEFFIEPEIALDMMLAADYLDL